MPWKKFGGICFSISSLPTALSSFTRMPNLTASLRLMSLGRKCSSAAKVFDLYSLKIILHSSSEVEDTLWAANWMKDCINEVHLTHSSEWTSWILYPSNVQLISLTTGSLTTLFYAVFYTLIYGFPTSCVVVVKSLSIAYRFKWFSIVFSLSPNVFSHIFFAREAESWESTLKIKYHSNEWRDLTAVRLMIALSCRWQQWEYKHKWLDT